MKSVVKLDVYDSPWELERASRRFVEHDHHCRPHESHYIAGAAPVLVEAGEPMSCPDCDVRRAFFAAPAVLERGEWREATQLFEEASAIGHQHGVYLECEGRELASLAHAYVELGRPERAREVALRAVALALERGSGIQGLENVVALARAEAAAGNDAAVDPLLARAEALIGATGAVRFHANLAEIRAERSHRRGDQATWRAELDTAHRLYTEMGAIGHTERLARLLSRAPRADL